MVQLAHYAEAIYLTSGSCFRLIQAEDGTGHAQHCPYLIEWRGRFKVNAGKWHTVEVCDGHRADVVAVRRVTTPARIAQLARDRPFWT